MRERLSPPVSPVSLRTLLATMEWILPWIALVLVLSATGGHGFYLPGVAPADFQQVTSSLFPPSGCWFRFALVILNLWICLYSTWIFWIYCLGKRFVRFDMPDSWDCRRAFQYSLSFWYVLDSSSFDLYYHYQPFLVVLKLSFPSSLPPSVHSYANIVVVIFDYMIYYSVVNSFRALLFRMRCGRCSAFDPSWAHILLWCIDEYFYL